MEAAPRAGQPAFNWRAWNITTRGLPDGTGRQAIMFLEGAGQDTELCVVEADAGQGHEILLRINTSVLPADPSSLEPQGAAPPDFPPGAAPKVVDVFWSADNDWHAARLWFRCEPPGPLLRRYKHCSKDGEAVQEYRFVIA
eukprot:tig00000093_g3530.t1